jgi:hypothetical protein
MRRSRFLVLLATFIVVLSTLLMQVGPALGADPDADHHDKTDSGENDPDRPPLGKDVYRKIYLRLRDQQIALYRGYPFPQAYNAREVALDQMREQQGQLRIPTDLTSPSVVVPAGVPTWTSIGPAPIPNGQVAGGATNVPVSGRVTSIAIDPDNAKDVYVGTAQGGLYRTTNGGTSWVPMMDGAATLAIGALAFAPSDHSRLYIGTGEGNLSGDSYSGIGLYRIDGANGGTPTLHGPFATRVNGTGTNAGTATNAFLGTSVTSIAVDPHNPARVFVATTFGGIGKASDITIGEPGHGFMGLWFSSNGTASTPTFSRVKGAPANSDGLQAVTDAIFLPGSSTTMLIGVEDFETGTLSGIYRTTTANKAAFGSPGVTPTFTKILGWSGTNALRNVRFTADKVSTKITVFAGREGGTPGGVLLRSTNGGQTFPTTIAHANGFCAPQCYYDIALALDPGNANKLYVGGSLDGTKSRMYQKSINAAAATPTFTKTDTNLHADTHAIAIAPSNHAVIYEGNDGGIFKSTDSGATWKSLNTSTFLATQFQSLAVHPTDPDFTIGGTQDNGTPFRNASGTWTRADFGDGGFSLIDQNATNTTSVTMYHTYFNQQNNLIGLARVTSTANAQDGGWTELGCGTGMTTNGISCTDNTLFYAPMALGPGNPNTLYFGTDRLYRSINKGTAMTVVGPNSPFEAGSPNVPVSAIAIAPSDDNIRVVGLQDGKVFRTTTTHATTWTNVTGGWVVNDNINNIHRNPFVSRIVVDPTDPNTAYVALDGFMGGATNGLNGLSHVWKTTSLGTTATWTEAGTGIPDIPVNALVMDPKNPQILYAGTDVGVYRTIDGGTSWAPFGAGLPAVAVFDLAVAQPGTATEVLRAATHGKGVWELPLP